MIEQKYTYYAFISYRHKNGKWTKWLKKKLQDYRLPTQTRKHYKDLPKRLIPIFYDVNLRPGGLNEQIKEEVRSSKFLLVMCSRAAAEEPKWLNDEINYFLSNGGDRNRIIPVIVDSSEDPVNETFPSRLRELNDEDPILGVDIPKVGKRSAILKIVSFMQGIKVEELESEESKRRKRKSLIAAAVALVVIICAALCIDYFRIKTESFLDYTEVYGCPVGIGPLRSDQAVPHYVIVSSRNKVREIRHENAYGELIQQDGNTHYDHPVNALYRYKDDGTLSQVTRKDENGNTTLVMFYLNQNVIDLTYYQYNELEGFAIPSPMKLDSHSTNELYSLENTQESKSNVSRYIVYYDDHGYTREIHYASGCYNDVGTDADGISGIRYTRDEQGRVTRLQYLKVEGSRTAARSDGYVLAGKKNGTAGMAYLYNDSYDLTEIRFLNLDGDPVPNEEGYAIYGTDYENHLEVRTFFLDKNHAPVLRISDNTAAWTRQFDAHGNVISESCFGTDGQPVINGFGYANVRMEYDQGKLTKTGYFGLSGEPVLSTGGYSSTEVFTGKTENGSETTLSFYGTDGKPVLSKYGFARIQYLYNPEGRITARICYGTDGELILSDAGYAKLESEYDEYGNLTEIRSIGTDLKPAVTSEGYAILRTEYDRRGNILIQSYYGADEKLIFIKGGYAVLKPEYDDGGNIERQSFYGTDEKPTLTVEGFASLRSEHDDRGNLIRQSYYGVNGELTIARDGYAVVEIAYDEQGNISRKKYFGTDGNPALNSKGCAEEAYDYDDRGNLTRISCYGPDGQLILSNEGYAVIEGRYDALGNQTEIS